MSSDRWLLGRWVEPARVESVPELRRRVVRAIEGVAVDRDVVALAVSEMVANVVRHAYPPSVDGDVSVTVELVDGELVLSVRDRGVGVRGFTASRDPGHGFGLAIVRHLADRVRIEPGSDGTEVELAFSVSVDSENA